MKRYGMLGVLVLVGLLLLALPAVVGAQAPTPPGTKAAVTATGPVSPTQGMMGGRGGGMMRGGNLVAVTAAETGLTEAEVVTALQGGQTFTQIAVANGSSKAKLVVAALAEHKTQLDQAVADGKLTQAQADARLKLAEVDLNVKVDQVCTPGQGGRMRGGRGGGMMRP